LARDSNGLEGLLTDFKGFPVAWSVTRPLHLNAVQQLEIDQAGIRTRLIWPERRPMFSEIVARKRSLA
jgi:hypothetical protein